MEECKDAKNKLFENDICDYASQVFERLFSGLENVDTDLTACRRLFTFSSGLKYTRKVRTQIETGIRLNYRAFIPPVFEMTRLQRC